ncbi:hypothetical protein [Simplicispira psychrophila]|uniref:hypothetical protein n=1 Tax=Simplicispira psychrophila TaxID=80882 RepID=UPI0012EB5351|nr:hypothetical protein [Simplicispira psychrophila]
MNTTRVTHLSPVTRSRLVTVNARNALRALVAAGQYEQSQLFAYVMGVGYH